METARRDHAEIGRVATHREQTPYPLQLIIVFQRIRVDQEHQRRTLPFVHGLHYAQRGVVVTARRHQCRVGQKLRTLIVKQAQGRRISPEFSDSKRVRQPSAPGATLRELFKRLCIEAYTHKIMWCISGTLVG